MVLEKLSTITMEFDLEERFRLDPGEDQLTDELQAEAALAPLEQEDLEITAMEQSAPTGAPQPSPAPRSRRQSSRFRHCFGYRQSSGGSRRSRWNVPSHFPFDPSRSSKGLYDAFRPRGISARPLRRRTRRYRFPRYSGDY